MLEKSCIPPHIENHYKCIHMLPRKQQYYWKEDEEPRTRAGRPSLVAEEARLTACHFIGYIPENKRPKCEV